jgi:hypothetical protein
VDEPVKRCSTCQVIRPLTDFNLRSSSRDGRQWRCRECSRAWYLVNKEQHLKNVAARNRRVREEYAQRLAAYLLEQGCADCGEDDIRVLEFDHNDPAEKLTEVGRLAGVGNSWARVEAEIAKCTVRCANCHRRRTAAMNGWHRAVVEQDRRAARTEQAQQRLARLLPAAPTIAL